MIRVTIEEESDNEFSSHLEFEFSNTEAAFRFVDECMHTQSENYTYRFSGEIDIGRGSDGRHSMDKNNH